MANYDVIIIGGGPAGYTAGLYCARASLQTLVIEQGVSGGQMANTYAIDNYPGAAIGIDGFTLGQNMKSQAEHFGAESRTATVTAVQLAGETKQIELESGETLSAKAVILAMGASPRLLGIPGEERLRGKGVSYCATCDGMFFRKKTVVVVGGGNTAVEDALLLAKTCEKVYLVHRRDTFRASAVYVEHLRNTDNIEPVLEETVAEILGEQKVAGVKLASGRQLDCDGVFIAVGNQPNTALVKDQIKLDAGGYVAADEDTATNIPGVYAAGDLRRKPLRQIVTAVADGAVAAVMAEKYILQNK